MEGIGLSSDYKNFILFKEENSNIEIINFFEKEEFSLKILTKLLSTEIFCFNNISNNNDNNINNINTFKLNKYIEYNNLKLKKMLKKCLININVKIFDHNNNINEKLPNKLIGNFINFFKILI
jgi:hypothetical protein